MNSSKEENIYKNSEVMICEAETVKTCEEVDPRCCQVYFDFVLNRAVAKFVAPEDLIVPYEAADLSSAERVTHAISMSRNEIKKQQLSGFYANVDIKEGSYSAGSSDVTEAIDEIEGTHSSYAEDRDHLVYEVHTILDLEGFEDMGEDGSPTGLKLPYIVTIDENSEEYQTYFNLSKKQIVNELYNTYENYIQRKYKIDIN